MLLEAVSGIEKNFKIVYLLISFYFLKIYYRMIFILCHSIKYYLVVILVYIVMLFLKLEKYL